jgi:hypothetical protein
MNDELNEESMMADDTLPITAGQAPGVLGFCPQPGRRGSLSMNEPEPAPRLAVIRGQTLVISNSGWSFRTVNDAQACVSLIAIRPEGSNADPAIVARTTTVEPHLYLGTIDELVASYREALENAYAQFMASPDNAEAIRITARAFENVASGVVEPLFNGRVTGA